MGATAHLRLRPQILQPGRPKLTRSMNLWDLYVGSLWIFEIFEIFVSLVLVWWKDWCFNKLILYDLYDHAVAPFNTKRNHRSEEMHSNTLGIQETTHQINWNSNSICSTDSGIFECCGSTLSTLHHSEISSRPSHTESELRQRPLRLHQVPLRSAAARAMPHALCGLKLPNSVVHCVQWFTALTFQVVQDPGRFSRMGY